MRMNWNQIMSEQRIPDKQPKEANRFRSEIESDYHRIIRSASFRRLQDKTQVFPLDQSDFVRTRLTHSLEVSSIAKLIGKQVCQKITELQLEDENQRPDIQKVMEILNCAGLLHDIGNPPFGHFGETAIRNWFQNNLSKKQYHGIPLCEILDEQQKLDLYNFEGNAQALRIVSKLHRLMEPNGLHLTSAVMDTIIKYPVNSIEKTNAERKQNKTLLEKKIGYFQSEEELFQSIKQNTGTGKSRNPLCFILEAADDLAYTFADLEDGYNKGMYSYHDLMDVIRLAEDFYGADLLKDLLFEAKAASHTDDDPYKIAVFTWLTKKQLYCVSQATDAFIAHYDEIMNGQYTKELLSEGLQGKLITELKTFAFHRIYNHSSILRIELMGNEVITFLLDRFVDALIPYDSNEDVSEIQMKYIQLISKNYLDNYHNCKSGLSEYQKLYHRLLLATDFICGMTDSYAKQLYKELKGIG